MFRLLVSSVTNQHAPEGGASCLCALQEPGDLHYGAVVLLGFTVSLLESLVGDGGLWLEKVPDLDLLAHLQVRMCGSSCVTSVETNEQVPFSSW